MTILVTGATGTIGSQIVGQLAGKGGDIRALVREPEKARLPQGVTAMKGDMLDVESMRAALSGVRTLFLLHAVAPDEFTQALITLNLAREAGIDRERTLARRAATIMARRAPTAGSRHSRISVASSPTCRVSAPART